MSVRHRQYAFEPVFSLTPNAENTMDSASSDLWVRSLVWLNTHEPCPYYFGQLTL